MTLILRSLLLSALVVASTNARTQAASDARAGDSSEGGVAVPAAPPRLRLHAGAGIADGGRGTMARWPGGATEYASCSPSCTYAPILDLGVVWSPWPHLGFGLRGRWVPGSARSVLGRRWDVLEVTFTPELDLPWPWRGPRGRMRPYLALPIGPAWSFTSRDGGRAVQEDWKARTGSSVGAALGFEFYLNRRIGFVGELSYQERFLSADVVETPVDEPQARASERVTLNQRYLTFTAGLLLGLDGL